MLSQGPQFCLNSPRESPACVFPLSSVRACFSPFRALLKGSEPDKRQERSRHFDTADGIAVLIVLRRGSTICSHVIARSTMHLPTKTANMLPPFNGHQWDPYAAINRRPPSQNCFYAVIFSARHSLRPGFGPSYGKEKELLSRHLHPNRSSKQSPSP